MKEEDWKKIGWFLIISIVILFVQAIISYQISHKLPADAKFLWFQYDNHFFTMGITIVILIIIWYIIEKNFKLKTKKRGLD